MGAMTTMRELASFWGEMTAEERLNYRVRFGDDVLEVISIEVQGDQAAVRGYQLNGPMAQTQRDDNSRAARVIMVAMTQGSVEILDRDEPVENDDPGPPPTLRLAESGEYEHVLDHSDLDEPPPPTLPVEQFNNPVAGLPRRGPLEPTPPPDNWAGDPAAMPKPPRAADTPVETWASTAIRLPHELLQRGGEAARQRMIGRNVLFAHLIEQGLNDLESKPVLGN